MRKNMKKLTVATVIGAMTVTALAPVSAQAKDKTLTVAIWDNGQKAGLQEIMDEFTKETGIKTELQVVEWSSYWTLLEAGASGGDMPDVFWMHSNEAVRYMSNDILLDLTDKIADSDKLEMDKFPEDIKEMYQWDGKHTQYRRTSIQLLCGTTKICLMKQESTIRMEAGHGMNSMISQRNLQKKTEASMVSQQTRLTSRIHG